MDDPSPSVEGDDVQTPATGVPEPSGQSPEAAARDPHHVLNNPVGEPDPTEWPDPYEQREDPADVIGPDGVARAAPGAVSTSRPHPDDDIQATGADAIERDRLDD